MILFYACVSNIKQKKIQCEHPLYGSVKIIFPYKYKMQMGTHVRMHHTHIRAYLQTHLYRQNPCIVPSTMKQTAEVFNRL